MVENGLNIPYGIILQKRKALKRACKGFKKEG
jgi:hypothetical protein